MDLRSPPTLVWFHLLHEFDGSEGRAADDQKDHRALLLVILLDFCPFGTNWRQEKENNGQEQKGAGRVK